MDLVDIGKPLQVLELLKYRGSIERTTVIMLVALIV